MVCCSYGGYSWEVESVTCDHERAQKEVEGSSHRYLKEVEIEDVGKGIEELVKEAKSRRW